MIFEKKKKYEDSHLQIKLKVMLMVIALLFSASIVTGNEGRNEKGKVRETKSQEIKSQEIINQVINTQRYTSEYFGVKFKPMKTVFLNNKGRLSDTIAMGRFDLFDAYSDFAVYHRGKGTIAIYSNQRNRFYEKTSEIELEKPVSKIESYLADEGVPIGLKRHGLKIKYKDGTEEKLEGDRLTGISDTKIKQENKVPERNFLDDARAFVYDYEFIEKKRFSTGYINDYTTVGDIDKDGLNELIYTFRTSSATNNPTHLVVFECLPGNQYRIDWDTILPKGWGNVYKDITDLDRDGRNECFVVGNRFNQYYNAMMQCDGPGKYSFHDNSMQLFPLDIAVVDTMHYDTLKRPGVWSLYQNQSYTYFLCQFVRKVNTAFYFQTVTGATFYGQGPYDIEVGDIDGDGKQEIVWGDCNSSGALYYIDSTGIATNSGYEAMYYEFPNQELGTGWSKLKDFDNDGKPEIIACSDAYGSGAIGVIKHTGEPGENKYQIMWRTTEGLYNAPNFGIDSGSINGKYTILYSLMKLVNGIDRLNLLTFTRADAGFSMHCTSFKEVDSSGMKYPVIFDLDKDGKADILGSLGQPYKHNLIIFGQDYVTNIIPTDEINVEDYRILNTYPNPFNQSSIVNFKCSISGNVSIVVYDLLGREVKTLVNENKQPGTYQVIFNAEGLSSGVYFIGLKTNNEIKDIRKIILMK